MVARLQSEFCTKDFCRATNSLTKNAPKISPKFLRLCSVGQKKSRKIPSKFPTKFSKFPCEKSKKNFTDELLQERRENNSTHFCLLLAVEFLAIPDPRLWESCRSRFAILWLLQAGPVSETARGAPSGKLLPCRRTSESGCSSQEAHGGSVAEQ